MGACDACGGGGAFMSMLGFGSFGAPIKSEAAKSVDVDPLVFQTYKTFMCFMTSWLVLAFGEPFTFTPWGIASACFWVPSGVAAIAGIKMAGLAVAMGTLSSFIVLVSFTWGIFVFDEQIHSRRMACFAIFLMMMGLVGMSYYSSLEKEEEEQQPQSTENPTTSLDIPESSTEYQPLADNSNDEEEAHDAQSRSAKTEVTAETCAESGVSREPLIPSDQEDHNNDAMPGNPSDYMLLFGTRVHRRVVGIACSVFCGIWGGSIMVPEKFAKANDTGVGYLISFGIGAAIVTAALWVFRFGYNYQRFGSATAAYYALPSMHIRVMWLPGCTAGLLWSIGNFGSLISVKYLGEGVGYSITQTAMLVSGLWGIFYFKEIKSPDIIGKWFLSASLCVLGIILLSYEHHEK
ncbi:expressed unknown protein [Seminavis robusta]|uniref:Uncharacterized protein n=1 Tax=Seminavis robusta TaxID=568900 RepID=A0A9N8DI51_9STRA|nr:expressed unknown protein [Seminavis robusta]|eukprot:Sro156_g070630.1 n/a (405) ;mRNA; f:11210-12910